MKDMNEADIVGQGTPHTFTYHDGTTRTVITTDVETKFPVGELIVSQTDLKGRLVLCNPAFVVMSGYEVDELLGEPHAILRHPDMPRAAFADLWATVSSGKRWTGYVKNLRKDGGYYWVFATVIPKIRKGELMGYTSVRREPSQGKIAEAEATYATLRQQEAAS